MVRDGDTIQSRGTYEEGAWERPGTSPVKAGKMRRLMSYGEGRPLTSPVRSRRKMPRKVSPVKIKKKKEKEIAQPFYRGLFGVKGSVKKISKGKQKGVARSNSRGSLKVKNSFR